MLAVHKLFAASLLWDDSVASHHSLILRIIVDIDVPRVGGGCTKKREHVKEAEEMRQVPSASAWMQAQVFS